MRKKLNLLFGLVLIISMIALIGCGGSGKTGEKNPYEGKWVAVSAQMMGMSVSIDETFGGAFEFEVKNNGKVSFSVGDTTGNGKWSVEDNQFILSIEGEEMVGIIGKDIISFDNMLEMGVKVIFAKDGTDAMDPALYLTEEENAVIGEWAAESVEELLGDGPQTSMEGVDNINDALRLDFKSDRNVTVIYKGEEIGTFPWSVALGYCSIESENPSLTVMINDDGTLKVDYFLRAESFYNVATKEEEYADLAHPSAKYHEKSHGESFLALAQNNLHPNGLYLFDEPEAALSPQRQLTLLMQIYSCAKEGAQFIIVTHSPILLGIPDADIYCFDNGRIHLCEYEDTESYQVTEMFINNRQMLLDRLLTD